MDKRATCPRCGEVVKPPGLWSSAWQCPTHGGVSPLQPVVPPSREVARAAARAARVPLWLPWPLPHGWVVTGLAWCGDDRAGARATVVACSGPSPVGGRGEMLLVAEEPGIGLGARYAGIAGTDPGDGATEGPPQAKVEAGGRPVALWCTRSAPDRAVYVGEAMGAWLWVVLWPESAGLLLAESLVLTDLRDIPAEVAVMPFGALSPHLLETPSAGPGDA